MAKQADVLMLLGRAFHKVAATTTNELSPAFTCVRTTVNKLLFAERNALAGLNGHKVCKVCWGIAVHSFVGKYKKSKLSPLWYSQPMKNTQQRYGAITPWMA